MYKAYFDASVNYSLKQVTTAFIIYDSNGSIFYQEAKNIGRNINKYDNNYTEWFALNQLLKTLRRLKINEVEIYGDNQNVISIANGLSRKTRNQELHRIIWKYGKKFEHISFNWISRKANKEADELTRSVKAVISLKEVSKKRQKAPFKQNTYAIQPNRFDFNFKYKEKKQKVIAR